MIDLKKVKLPSTIEVGGSFFEIKTDFRTWLAFSELCSDEDTTLDDFDFIYKESVPENKALAFSQLVQFYNPPREYPKSTGDSNNIKVLDYVVDADFIYSAFLEQYNIDLLATDKFGHATVNLHWWQFTALLSSLYGTKLNEIMEFRSFEPDGKDKSQHQKQMKKLKKAWELPQIHSISKEQEHFNSLFQKKE